MKLFVLSFVTALGCLISGSAAPDLDQVAVPVEPAVQEVEEEIDQAEDQVRQAKTQIKEVSKAWKEAAKAMQAAQVAVAGESLEEWDESDEHWDVFPGAMAAVKDKLFALSAPARLATKPLIILGGRIDGDVQAGLEEDLSVMSRILNKVTSGRGAREEHDWAMGIALSSLGSGRRPQSIYLEGYGALFLLNVKFPLVAPPKKQAEEKKPGELPDSEWEQTKDELFGDVKVRRRHGPFTEPFPGPDGVKAEYRPGRVDELKKNILEALKNASNIRHVKPDESITVAVTGPVSARGTQVRRIYRKAIPGESETDTDRAETDVFAVVRAGKVVQGDETHLTIRVKKADVEAFAKGNLTFEEFEKNASVVSY
jgi:hypothetical protein